MDLKDSCIPLMVNTAMSCLASIAVYQLIPKFKGMFLSAGLSGVDMNKVKPKESQSDEVWNKPTL